MGFEKHVADTGGVCCRGNQFWLNVRALVPRTVVYKLKIGIFDGLEGVQNIRCGSIGGRLGFYHQQRKTFMIAASTDRKIE